MIEIREPRSEDDLATVLTLCKDFFAEYEGYHKEFFDTDNLTDADISDRFLQSIKSPPSLRFWMIRSSAMPFWLCGSSLISTRSRKSAPSPVLWSRKTTGARG